MAVDGDGNLQYLRLMAVGGGSDMIPASTAQVGSTRLLI